MHLSDEQDPKIIIVAGDVHGDPEHMMYLYQIASDKQADAIVQVGDFGYFEHHPDGWAFLDLCSEGFQLSGIPLYWIDGNHENHQLLRDWYGPGSDRHQATAEGFWVIRPGVYYIPRGTRWTWNDYQLMGLGGAYSPDKRYRLRMQRDDGVARWWPEEELTDADVAHALQDRTELDVLFTHDKPRDAKVPWNRRDIPLALPNQDKIQRVVDRLNPKLVVHGHLHYRYTAQFGQTTVEGLDRNPQSPEDDPMNSWIVLRLP